ncbi:hypothetical protein [Aliiroseovarius sediminis]|uniref:hypothetical protein n=1 Tax=Aliiroseovarius sediminis TaxID=2925839 RepID=UPI001F58950D|nr:hypothetical protein [Aliiroseovarius sediminis]MCI2395108.1 hypothetical protein [Aliiroseovarius sediminis]
MTLLMTARENRIKALTAIAASKSTTPTPRPTFNLKRCLPVFRSARRELSAPLLLT